jgi:hypothetical protein
MLSFISPSFRADLSRPVLPFAPSARMHVVARRTLAIGAYLASILPAHAGRPLATDNAAIVDADACQLETWTERTRSGHSSWVNAGCNPFGTTELSLGAARVAYGATSFAAQQWQIKQLLRAHDETQIGYAVALGGDRVRRANQHGTFAATMITLPLAGEARLLHLNLGARHDRQDGQRHNHATWGAAFDVEAMPATRTSLESFGISGERANWRLGLRRELVLRHVQIDASVGSAIGRWRDSGVVTLGFVFASPAFLR